VANQQGSPDKAVSEQKQAEQTGRFFNSAFNSAILYGGSHPTTLENVLPLHQQAGKQLERATMLTLSVERESVFVENCCVDKVLNAKRIVGYFKKAGIESVTFERGITPDEMRAFFRAVGDVRDAPSVKAIQEILASARAGRIRINYVSYRKVTADEAVIGKQNMAAASAGESPAGAFPTERSPDAPAGGKRGPGVSDVLRELMPVMEAREALAGSNPPTEPPAGAAAEQEPGRDVAVLSRRLKNLSAQIQTGGASDIFATPQEMMEAVVKLRQDVTRSMDLMKAAGRLADAGGGMAEELDNLGRETIIRLIRDEYKQGAVSVKRLAQVIRRLLPDVKELKKVIPFLKESLLADGMSLADYLQLVSSLVHELEDEGLAQSLAGAAEEMGLSMDEILQGIKSDPADTARLIILASEIRKGTGGSAEQLSAILADYVEKVSQSLSAGAKDQSNSQTVLHGFETQLLEKFKAQGVGETVVDSVRRRIEKTTKRGFELPKGVFDIKVTGFFLDHEIKRNTRYNSPFSAFVLSLVSIVREGGAESAGTPEETGMMMTLLETSVKKMLRDLDLVGNMLWISENVPFIILPMTGAKGAKSVQDRVMGELNKLQVPIAGAACRPRVVVTATAFDGKITRDTASFFKYIMQLHQEDLKRARGK
jgi:hypothetical protein